MEDDKRFEARVALLIAVLALLLGVTGVFGANNDQLILHQEMEAADTWAWFQAKNIRKSSTQIAFDTAAMQTSAGHPQLVKWQAEIERLRTDPEDGMDALMAKARAHEGLRDEGLRRDPFYDFGEALLQLAIVLASVAIIMKKQKLAAAAGLAGAAGTICTLIGLLQ